VPSNQTTQPSWAHVTYLCVSVNNNITYHATSYPATKSHKTTRKEHPMTKAQFNKL